MDAHVSLEALEKFKKSLTQFNKGLSEEAQKMQWVLNKIYEQLQQKHNELRKKLQMCDDLFSYDHAKRQLDEFERLFAMFCEAGQECLKGFNHQELLAGDREKAIGKIDQKVEVLMEYLSAVGGSSKGESTNSMRVLNQDFTVHGVKNTLTLEDFNKVRGEFNPPLPPRTGDDDPNTIAILRGDDFELKEKNAHGKQEEIMKEVAVNNVSKTHAEVGVLFELYKIRKSKGILGGKAVLYIDKAPCGYCRSKYDLNAIKNMVEQSRLDRLDVYYLDEGKMKEWIVEPDAPFRRMSWSITKEVYEVQRKEYTKILSRERAKERRKKK